MKTFRNIATAAVASALATFAILAVWNDPATRLNLTPVGVSEAPEDTSAPSTTTTTVSEVTEASVVVSEASVIVSVPVAQRVDRLEERVGVLEATTSTLPPSRPASEGAPITRDTTPTTSVADKDSVSESSVPAAAPVAPSTTEPPNE